MFESIAAILKASFERAPWGWGVLTAMIAGYFKLKPTLIKLANEREANLLKERAAEMEEMRARLAKLEAERAADRHRLNNVTQCLDALLLMIEMDPAKAKQAAARIKDMRAEQMKAEALEKAAIHSAELERVAKIQTVAATTPPGGTG